MFHILVVDDDKNTRLLFRAVLEDAGYTVSAAENGEEALAVLDREHVDLVVLDVMMPKPDFSPAKPEQADEPPKGAPPAFCFSRRGGGALRGGTVRLPPQMEKRVQKAARLPARRAAFMRGEGVDENESHIPLFFVFDLEKAIEIQVRLHGSTPRKRITTTLVGVLKMKQSTVSQVKKCLI